MIKPNEIFKDNIKFYKYFRSGSVYFTDDLYILNQLLSYGWKYDNCDCGFKLKPPSVTLCSIVDNEKAGQYMNQTLNLMYFDYLSELSNNNKLLKTVANIINQRELFYKNFECHISKGPTLVYEFIVEGSDKRVFNLKYDMLIYLLKSDWYERNREKYNKLCDRRNNQDSLFAPNNKVTECFFKELVRLYSPIKNIVINQYSSNIDANVINYADYDYLFFIPYGCFKFIAKFVNDDNYSKVMLSELHVGDNTSVHSLFIKSFKNKRVLIIDKVYSGKTIDKAKKMIEAAGGEATSLGIYPTSYQSIIKTDYCLILNKIYKSSSLVENETNIRLLYINTMSGVCNE